MADECSAHRSSVGVPLNLGIDPPKRFDGILSFLEVDLLPFHDWRFFREVARRRVPFAGSVDFEAVDQRPVAATRRTVADSRSQLAPRAIAVEREAASLI
jgi:hypothetical protein